MNNDGKRRRTSLVVELRVELGRTERNSGDDYYREDRWNRFDRSDSRGCAYSNVRQRLNDFSSRRDVDSRIDVIVDDWQTRAVRLAHRDFVQQMNRRVEEMVCDYQSSE